MFATVAFRPVDLCYGSFFHILGGTPMAVVSLFEAVAGSYDESRRRLDTRADLAPGSNIR